MKEYLFNMGGRFPGKELSTYLMRWNHIEKAIIEKQKIFKIFDGTKLKNGIPPSDCVFEFDIETEDGILKLIEYLYEEKYENHAPLKYLKSIMLRRLNK